MTVTLNKVKCLVQNNNKEMTPSKNLLLLLWTRTNLIIRICNCNSSRRCTLSYFGARKSTISEFIWLVAENVVCLYSIVRWAKIMTTLLELIPFFGTKYKWIERWRDYLVLCTERNLHSTVLYETVSHTT